MHLKSTITERVEALVRHPVFAGGDKAMDLVLDDLSQPQGMTRKSPGPASNVRPAMVAVASPSRT
jgi:hypothetical protein